MVGEFGLEPNQMRELVPDMYGQLTERLRDEGIAYADLRNALTPTSKSVLLDPRGPFNKCDMQKHRDPGHPEPRKAPAGWFLMCAVRERRGTSSQTKGRLPTGSLPLFLGKRRGSTTR